MLAVPVDTIDLAAYDIDADIQRYVSRQLQNSQRLGRLTAELKLLVQEELAQKSDGMFRWVACQLQMLKNLPSFQPKHVRRTLKNLPRTLDQTYERMLMTIEYDYHEDARALLCWLAYTQSPPTLGQLVEALVIQPEKNNVDCDERGNLEDALNILSGLVVTIKTNKTDRNEEDFAEDCGSDAEDVDAAVQHRRQDISADTKVRFAHFSVKEYLESTRILEGGAKIFHLEFAREHRFLSYSCITYLMHYSRSSDKRSTEQDFITFPLAEYAAKSWYHHSSFYQDTDVNREVTFLDSTGFRQDWLMLYQPDQPWRGHFETPEHEASGLYYASLTGLIQVTKKLLDKGADVNAPGGRYGNALQAASWGGHNEMVQLLLDKGADVNAQGGACHNALQAASKEGHNEVVQILLDKGADVNAKGGGYGNALQSASSGGYIKLAQLLLDKGADVNAQGGYYSDALQAASAGGDRAMVQLLLNKGADINAQGGRYGSALHAASWGGHTKTVQLLLNENANVNVQGGRYGNALQAASWKGHGEIVQLLLDKGANINAQGGQYGNALQAASEGGHSEIVQLLLSRGADSSARPDC